MPKTIKLEPHLLESKELEDRYRKARDPVERSHYQIVWSISEGKKSTRQIMEATGYSRGWVQQLARRYNSGGPEALGDRRHHNPGARDRALLDQARQRELAQALRKPPEDGGMWNSGKVGEWIEAKTGKKVASKKQRGWEYLKRLGNSPKVPPRPHHRKADKSETERLSKKATDEEGGSSQGSLPDGEGRAVERGRAPPGPQADRRPQGVESPIGQRGHSSRSTSDYEWGPTFTPIARPKSGEVHWLVLPTVNAEAFSMALENFAGEVGAGKRKRILLVLDRRAGWHTAKKKLKVPEGIRPEFLPSHSPELQPSERLWPLSNEAVANRHFEEEIEDLEEALVERCVALGDRPDEVTSARTSATTGGRRRREKQDYSNGLGITRRPRLLLSSRG